MLSHLRFHRRAPSNPTSPLPDQLSSWEAAPLHEHPQTVEDVSPRPDARPRSSNSSMPPTLPPIARVTSADSEPSFPHTQDGRRPVSQDSRTPPVPRAYGGGNTSGSTGFIGGVALQNSRRPPPPPITTTFAPRPAPLQNKQQVKTASSFVTPTDLQQSSAGGFNGKRPSGTRLASEPAGLGSGATESHNKGKKGLPFLKNPMSSLLMRRKTGQNAPDLQPLPVPKNEPSYDPRIRGTKVHDFSAPRPKKVLPRTDVASPASATTIASSGGRERPDLVGQPGEYTPNSAHRPEQFDPSKQHPLEVTRELSVDPPAYPNIAELPADSIAQEARRQSWDKPLPQQPAPQVPPKDDAVVSLRTSSSAASRASLETSVFIKSNASARTARSHKMSLSEASARDSVVSAVPRHMKSTSSRFSFDMIGAAKQERLLEERHRQRELEKKATDGAQGPRESGYDEFDEDAFDYDAMMDDDGLEERIPGVNADLEEEEDEEDYEAAFDPDNDQENFAGFTFQRSNPTSTLASPLPPGTGMLATPRDSNGNVIGFAETKDATPGLPPSPLPTFGSDPATAPGPDDAVLGLGIQELHIQDQVAQDEAVTAPQDDVQQEAAATVDPAPSTKRVNDDDIYFDDGLADELDFEHDGTVFDESIFDNNDTDRYGRPIPGAFAQAAQAMRAAQQQQVASRRESDMTSRLSAQSGISQSTAHTSLSADLQLQQLTTTEKEKEQQDPRQDPQPGPLSAQKTWSDTASRMAIPGQDLAYQAALAEAAQKAAASGKFRRDSSPPLPSELTIITSPTDPGESRNHPDPHVDASLEDYEAEDDDEQYGNELDDFDFDDEAIIAEANASALASDSDGWYGHEFGFYSAPPPQPHHGLSHQSSSSSSSSIALSAENLYQYANGGYFGPGGQGLGRSTSGRVVSREPNLTPITERSEYSNRNSIMSLALPPPIGSESNRNSVPLQSPGLAQLAMMADDDNMSLSALLKLRSKAWGGSQASLASSRDGSPRSERVAAPAGGDPTGSPWGTGSGVFSPGFTGPPGGPSVAGSQQQQQHGRRNSAFSIWSTSDAAAGASGSGSPTLTNQQLPMVTFPLMSSPPMVQGIMASPPFSPGNGVNAINPSSGGIIMGGPLIVGPPLSPSPFASSPPQQQQQFSAAAAPTLPPLPPISPGLFLPALGLGGGGGPCSPVLEAEEATSAAFAPAAPSEQQQQQQQQPNINVMSSHSHLPSPPASSSPPLPLSPVQQCQQPRNNTVGTATVNVVGRPGSSQGLGRGHRHKGSADSISYTKEEITDYSSGTGNGGGREKTRWVMERRRTAESGEVEILGREVIEDGRI